jgi:hypothetical protein
MTSTRIRRDIRDLSADELQRLRQAFARLQSDSGANGYQTLAGHHGEPRWHCPHGSALFLPWHREYILRLEAALRSIDETIDLPFFDWADDRAAQQGLPPAYTDASYTLADGTPLPNAIGSAAIGPIGRATRRAGSRNPLSLRSYAQSVNLALGERSFGLFGRMLEGPHGSFHVWVGGDMGTPRYSAYDPVFWAHHATVDRQWARWQRSPNAASPSPALLDQTLPGFGGRRVRDVMDHTALGYDYAGLGAQPDTIAELWPAITNAASTIEGADTSTRSRTRKPRVVLRLDGVRRDAGSFATDVFVNLAGAGPDTSVDGNPHFAGSFGILGMAGGHHHHAHAAATGLAPDETNADTLTLDVDITDAVERLAIRPSDVEVALIPHTAAGLPIDASELPIGEQRVRVVTPP